MSKPALTLPVFSPSNSASRVTALSVALFVGGTSFASAVLADIPKNGVVQGAGPSGLLSRIVLTPPPSPPPAVTRVVTRPVTVSPAPVVAPPVAAPSPPLISTAVVPVTQPTVAPVAAAPAPVASPVATSLPVAAPAVVPPTSNAVGPVLSPAPTTVWAPVDGAPLGGGLGELLPGAQALAATMRSADSIAVGSVDPAGVAYRSTSPGSGPSACVAVRLAPHPQRAETTLVDLTGDGLIVSALPSAQAMAVLARAGHGGVSLSSPLDLCLPQVVTRELVRSITADSARQATSILKEGDRLRLMSAAEWSAHQAALQDFAPARKKVVAAKSKRRVVRTRVAKRLVRRPTVQSVAPVADTPTRSAALAIQRTHPYR